MRMLPSVLGATMVVILVVLGLYIFSTLTILLEHADKVDKVIVPTVMDGVLTHVEMAEHEYILVHHILPNRAGLRQKLLITPPPILWLLLYLSVGMTGAIGGMMYLRYLAPTPPTTHPLPPITELMFARLGVGVIFGLLFYVLGTTGGPISPYIARAVDGTASAAGAKHVTLTTMLFPALIGSMFPTQFKDLLVGVGQRILGGGQQNE